MPWAGHLVILRADQRSQFSSLWVSDTLLKGIIEASWMSDCSEPALIVPLELWQKNHKRDKVRNVYWSIGVR